jgi:hypothetical protein
MTELESHPSVTKTLWGVAGVAAAAFFSGPFLEAYSRHHLCFAHHLFVVAGRAVFNAMD